MAERGFLPFILYGDGIEERVLSREGKEAGDPLPEDRSERTRREEEARVAHESEGKSGEKEERTSHSGKDDFLQSRLFLSPSLCTILLFFQTHTHTHEKRRGTKIERRGEAKGGKRSQRIAKKRFVGWFEREKRKGKDGKKAGDSKTAPLIRRLGSDVPIFQEQYR